MFQFSLPTFTQHFNSIWPIRSPDIPPGVYDLCRGNYQNVQFFNFLHEANLCTGRIRRIKPNIAGCFAFQMGRHFGLWRSVKNNVKFNLLVHSIQIPPLHEANGEWFQEWGSEREPEKSSKKNLYTFGGLQGKFKLSVGCKTPLHCRWAVRDLNTIYEL